jgi:hypothetical protein
MGLCASTLDAQELQEGKWSGTRVNLINKDVQNFTFEVKRMPDPLARWRIGPGLLIATFTIGQNKFPLKELRQDGESLSYVITQPNGVVYRFSLTRQKDGSFAGEGTRILGNVLVFKVTMIPPEAKE